jgi:chromosome segregation ATPase
MTERVYKWTQDELLVEMNRQLATIATLLAKNAELRAEVEMTKNHLEQANQRNLELRLEISEHVLRADSLRAEIRRLEEELELDGRDAVSEAVERIVAALGIAKGATDSHDYDVLTESDSSFYEGVFSGNLEGIDRSIALLRSRDWSKGDADA